MANILEFRQHASQEPCRRPRRESEPAQIVIFPGIRYERWDDTERTRAADTRQGTAHRDMLKLVD